MSAAHFKGVAPLTSKENKISLLDLINQQRAKLQRPTNLRPEKLSSEKNLVRILLNEVGGETQMSQNWGQHFVKDQSGQLKAVYICTQTNFDEPCAVCEAIAHGMSVTSDEDLIKVLKDSKSSKRILVNALYLKGGKHENPESNPVVLDLPPSVWDSILATAQAFAAEGVNVFDPDEGHNFIIEKTGAGMNTEYKVTPSPRGSAIPNKSAVLGKLKDLADWARQESEQDRNRAVTSVRYLTGGSSATVDRTAAARIAGPSSKTAQLAKMDADVIEADFTEVSTGSAASGDDLEDFLRDL